MVDQVLNGIRHDHNTEGNLNSIVARLVKKVRKNKNGDLDNVSDDNNIVVTRAKKGPSLSEINY
jgi:hypothetical protein